MARKNRICYICGNSATSKEHVPPLCLFPEKKDVKTDFLRQNLITVPSCDLHNSKKSKDDEFLFACISGAVGNNIIGFFQKMTKVQRLLAHRGDGFLPYLENQELSSTINDRPGTISPVLINGKNFDRLQACFEHISRGLYYHEFKQVFKGECRIVMDFLDFKDDKREKFKLLCRKRYEMEPDKPKTKGSNPEVFRYDFMKPDSLGIIALRMVFYEGATVYAALAPEGVKPFYLAGELIEAGITTIVGFPDGSEIVFNEKDE